MWRWVFLDVGNVLFDEDPLTYVSFRRHAEAVARVQPSVTFGALLALREAHALASSRWPVYEAVANFLSDEQYAGVWETTAREVRARYDELSPPIPGAVELLDSLAPRFRLGLIANQGPECRTRLATLGWLDRFDITVLSEEHGCSKPDPELFQIALRAAGAAPAECLMVGDRLDNDIAPATALGLATAWVRWPNRAAKGWCPDDPESRAYRASLERSSRASIRRFSDLRPTLASDEIRDLLGLI